MPKESAPPASLTPQGVPQGRLGFVQGRLPIFVADADQSPTADQVLVRTERATVARDPGKLSAPQQAPQNCLPACLLSMPTGPTTLAPSMAISKHHTHTTRCAPPPDPAGNPHLGHLLLAPEAGIMQGGVPVLVHCVDVSFELDELGGGEEMG